MGRLDTAAPHRGGRPGKRDRMDIDLTILFQLALFLGLLVSLTEIIIRPMMKVIDARYERLEGGKAEVERLERLADENRSAYQARIHEARDVARREREGKRAKGNQESREILADVRAEIALKLNATRDDIRVAEAEAQAALAADTDTLARSLVTKIIGREVSL